MDLFVYAVFKVHARSQDICSGTFLYVTKVFTGFNLLKPDGLNWAFPPLLKRLDSYTLNPNGLKWTRTTDLTLIRRAL